MPEQGVLGHLLSNDRRYGGYLRHGHSPERDSNDVAHTEAEMISVPGCAS